MFEKLFSFIRQALMSLGLLKTKKGQDILPDYSSFYDDYITMWKDIFKGNTPWKEIKYTHMGKQQTRQMAGLGTAKVLCSELSMITFAEQVNIFSGNKDVQERINHILKHNGFWENFSNWLETAYACGGGVLKCYLANGKAMIDYVDADSFMATSWNKQAILGGVFISQTYKNNRYYTLIESHEQVGKSQHVTNTLYSSKQSTELGFEASLDELYPELERSVVYENVDSPMFSYFRPAIANNIDTKSPLGISVFANAIDTLKALDVAFDSFSREFILGKKRIIVPSSAVRTFPDENGKLVRYFDANDEAYVSFNCDEEKDLKITDNTVEIRVDEHISSINALLNILCFQTGLSAGSFSFDSKGLKTATEVISENTKTQRVKSANQNSLKLLLESSVRNLILLDFLARGKSIPEYDLTITFKDNVVIDDNTLIDNNIKLVQAGLKSKVSAIMEVLKCDEDTAKAELEKIVGEEDIGANVLDGFGEE